MFGRGGGGGCTRIKKKKRLKNNNSKIKGKIKYGERQKDRHRESADEVDFARKTT